MPTDSNPRSLSAERRRDALRALLAAIAAVPPHPASCWWLASCSSWRLSSVGRKP